MDFVKVLILFFIVFEVVNWKILSLSSENFPYDQKRFVFLFFTLFVKIAAAIEGKDFVDIFLGFKLMFFAKAEKLPPIFTEENQEYRLPWWILCIYSR